MVHDRRREAGKTLFKQRDNFRRECESISCRNSIRKPRELILYKGQRKHNRYVYEDKENDSAVRGDDYRDGFELVQSGRSGE